ncbi:MAG: glycerophosphodiester phosphodiesterase family protein, partial [Candidatus Omnitrophota bacterium]
MNIYHPRQIEINSLLAQRLNETIREAIKSLIEKINSGADFNQQLAAVCSLNQEKLSDLQQPYLSIFLLYATDILEINGYAAAQEMIRQILERRKPLDSIEDSFLSGLFTKLNIRTTPPDVEKPISRRLQPQRCCARDALAVGLVYAGAAVGLALSGIYLPAIVVGMLALWNFFKAYDIYQALEVSRAPPWNTAIAWLDAKGVSHLHPAAKNLRFYNPLWHEKAHFFLNRLGIPEFLQELVIHSTDFIGLLFPVQLQPQPVAISLYPEKRQFTLPPFLAYLPREDRSAEDLSGKTVVTLSMEGNIPVALEVYAWDEAEPYNPLKNQAVKLEVYAVNRGGSTLLGLVNRQVFDVLYPGSDTHGLMGRAHRFTQEIVFGKAVYQLLQRMNLRPDILHLNEAHTVVAAALVRADENFKETAIVYTNHTLVPAGLEIFTADSVHADTDRMMYEIGIPEKNHQKFRPVFLKPNSVVDFCHAAVRLADAINAVSKEHAIATRRLFKAMYGEEFNVQVIGALNGSGKSWKNKQLIESEEQAQVIDKEQLYSIHEQGRREAFAEIKNRTGIELDPNKPAFWLVRRLVEYKSQYPILRFLVHLFCADREKTFTYEQLKTIWNNFIAQDLEKEDEKARVYNQDFNQLIEFILFGLFDGGNKEVINGLGAQLVVGGPEYEPVWVEAFKRWSKEPELKGKFVYAPDSDTELIRMQAIGADVCITIPRPLEEACGTSSQRTAANGGVNITIRGCGDIEWLSDYNEATQEGSALLLGSYYIQTPGGLFADIIKFYREAPADLFKKAEIASRLFYTDKEKWKQLMHNSYLASFKVTAAAMEERYIPIYLQAIENRKAKAQELAAAASYYPVAVGPELQEDYEDFIPAKIEVTFDNGKVSLKILERGSLKPTQEASFKQWLEEVLISQHPNAPPFDLAAEAKPAVFIFHITPKTSTVTIPGLEAECHIISECPKDSREPQIHPLLAEPAEKLASLFKVPSNKARKFAVTCYGDELGHAIRGFNQAEGDRETLLWLVLNADYLEVNLEVLSRATENGIYPIEQWRHKLRRVKRLLNQVEENKTAVIKKLIEQTDGKLEVIKPQLQTYLSAVGTPYQKLENSLIDLAAFINQDGFDTLFELLREKLLYERLFQDIKLQVETGKNADTDGQNHTNNGLNSDLAKVLRHARSSIPRKHADAVKELSGMKRFTAELQKRLAALNILIASLAGDVHSNENERVAIEEALRGFAYKTCIAEHVYNKISTAKADQVINGLDLITDIAYSASLKKTIIRASETKVLTESEANQIRLTKTEEENGKVIYDVNEKGETTLFKIWNNPNTWVGADCEEQINQAIEDGDADALREIFRTLRDIPFERAIKHLIRIYFYSQDKNLVAEIDMHMLGQFGLTQGNSKLGGYMRNLFEALKKCKIAYSDGLINPPGNREKFGKKIFAPLEAGQLKAILNEEREYGIYLVQYGEESLLLLYREREGYVMGDRLVRYILPQGLLTQEGHSHKVSSDVEPSDQPGDLSTAIEAFSLFKIKDFLVHVNSSGEFELKVFNGADWDTYLGDAKAVPVLMKMGIINDGQEKPRTNGSQVEPKGAILQSAHREALIRSNMIRTIAGALNKSRKEIADRFLKAGIKIKGGKKKVSVSLREVLKIIAKESKRYQVRYRATFNSKKNPKALAIEVIFFEKIIGGTGLDGHVRGFWSIFFSKKGETAWSISWDERHHKKWPRPLADFIPFYNLSTIIDRIPSQNVVSSHIRAKGGIPLTESSDSRQRELVCTNGSHSLNAIINFGSILIRLFRSAALIVNRREIPRSRLLSPQHSRDPPRVLRIIPAPSRYGRGEENLTALAEQIRKEIIAGFPADIKIEIAPPNSFEDEFADAGVEYVPGRHQYVFPYYLDWGFRKDTPTLVITDVDITNPKELKGPLADCRFGLTWPSRNIAITSLSQLQGRERNIKNAKHEAGHLFGLEDCSNPSCVMHFSASPADLAKTNNDFCPSCQEKLQNFSANKLEKAQTNGRCRGILREIKFIVGSRYAERSYRISTGLHQTDHTFIEVSRDPALSHSAWYAVTREFKACKKELKSFFRGKELIKNGFSSKQIEWFKQRILKAKSIEQLSEIDEAIQESIKKKICQAIGDNWENRFIWLPVGGRYSSETCFTPDQLDVGGSNLLLMGLSKVIEEERQLRKELTSLLNEACDQKQLTYQQFVILEKELSAAKDIRTLESLKWEIIGQVQAEAPRTNGSHGLSRAVKMFAHRGCFNVSDGIPECSLPAFVRAMEMGLDGFELDAQVTQDGIVMASHHEPLEKLTNGSGWIKEYSFVEIRKLRLRRSRDTNELTGLTIPRLQEVIDLVKNSNIQIQIHIEDINAIDAVLKVVVENNFAQRVTVSSKSKDTKSAFEILSEVRKRNNEVKTAIILSPRSSDRFPRDTESTQELLKETKASGVSIFDLSLRDQPQTLTQEVVYLIRQEGSLGISVGFQSADAGLIRRMVNLGVDRIICESPEAMAQVKLEMADSAQTPRTNGSAKSRLAAMSELCTLSLDPANYQDLLLDAIGYAKAHGFTELTVNPNNLSSYISYVIAHLEEYPAFKTKVAELLFKENLRGVDFEHALISYVIKGFLAQFDRVSYEVDADIELARFQEDWEAQDPQEKQRLLKEMLVRTKREILRIWNIDRAKMMVKVPNTPIGQQAIEELKRDYPVIINFTLFFSLEDSQRGVRPLGEKDVLSQFVSRIDALTQDAKYQVPLNYAQGLVGLIIAKQYYDWCKANQIRTRTIMASLGAKTKIPGWMYVYCLTGGNQILTMPLAQAKAIEEGSDAPEIRDNLNLPMEEFLLPFVQHPDCIREAKQRGFWGEFSAEDLKDRLKAQELIRQAVKEWNELDAKIKARIFTTLAKEGFNKFYKPFAQARSDIQALEQKLLSEETPRTNGSAKSRLAAMSELCTLSLDPANYQDLLLDAIGYAKA